MDDDARIVRVTETCIGVGLCLAIAPDTFTFSSNGRARASTTPPATADAVDAARRAARACPAHAIHLVKVREAG